jgi:hypothetical protein
VATSAVETRMVLRVVPFADRAMSRTRLSAHTYFLLSAVFHYLGPAFAVLLFAPVDGLGVAWLWIAEAASGPDGGDGCGSRGATGSPGSRPLISRRRRCWSTAG